MDKLFSKYLYALYVLYFDFVCEVFAFIVNCHTVFGEKNHVEEIGESGNCGMSKGRWEIHFFLRMADERYNDEINLLIEHS